MNIGDIVFKVILSLITTGALGVCGYLGKQLTNYKKLLKEKDDEHIISIIDTRLEPFRKELEDLKESIALALEDEEALKSSLVSSYKFRLMQLCKIYIRQKCLTQDQYDQLSEFFRIYELLGGNGQAKVFYEKAIELPIVENIELFHKKEGAD